MISRKKKERLKDILIDHVYDYCYNQIVQKIEGDGIKMTSEVPSLLNEETDKIILDKLSKSKKIKMYYETRQTKYCNIILTKDDLHKSLLEKLKQLGFSKGKNLKSRVVETHNLLLNRSYFAKNQPIENEVRLTEKGIKHYLDGKSFEDEYISRRNSNIAIVISISSIIIAIIAIFINP